jgi:uncharacterized protein
VSSQNRARFEINRRSFGILAVFAGAVGLRSALAQESTNASNQESIMNNIEIAKTYIKAVQTGDQAMLGSVISPNVVWHQPGNNQFSGTHSGMSAVGAMLGKMMEVSKGTFAISKADYFMANGDWVAIQLEFSGAVNGVKMIQSGVDLFRIEGGKIVEVRLFSSNQDEEDLFWGK